MVGGELQGDGPAELGRDHVRRIDMQLVEKVDEILPKLFEEARLVAEPEKEMVPIVAEWM